jgi:hypothetical protein
MALICTLPASSHKLPAARRVIADPLLQLLQEMPVAAIPDTSITGRRVARELTTLVERSGKPDILKASSPAN